MHEHPTEAANVQVGPPAHLPLLLLPPPSPTPVTHHSALSAAEPQAEKKKKALIGSLRSRSADRRICFFAAQESFC